MQKLSARKFHFEPPSHHSITSSAMASSIDGRRGRGLCWF
jgi:hypothetical protein